MRNGWGILIICTKSYPGKGIPFFSGRLAGSLVLNGSVRVVENRCLFVDPGSDRRPTRFLS
jgi:hypothetical protein